MNLIKVNEVSNNDFFTGVLGKNASPVKTLTEIFTKKQEHSVQVTISEKGQEFYRKSIQEPDGKSENYDAMIE